jgi:addiction module HigA family antidote
VATGESIGPVTPGDVLLREEFMAPLGLFGYVLARGLGVPSNRVTEIVAGERSITAETAILLGERFATSARFASATTLSMPPLSCCRPDGRLVRHEIRGGL